MENTEHALSTSLALHVMGAMNPAIHNHRWYSPLLPGVRVNGSNQNNESTVSFQSTTISTDFDCWVATSRVHPPVEPNDACARLINLARDVFVQRLAYTPITSVRMEVKHTYSDEEVDVTLALKSKFPIFDMKLNDSGVSFFTVWEAADSVEGTSRQSRIWGCNKKWHLHFAHMFDFTKLGLNNSVDFSVGACLDHIESNNDSMLSMADWESRRMVREVIFSGVPS